MARTKQTARKSTGGKAPRKQLVCRCGPPQYRPQCSQEPITQDVKEVSRASIVLLLKGVSDFMTKSGNTVTSASISAGGIQWQLRVETSAAVDGGRLQLGCSLEGTDANGAWSRWLTADFFVFNQEVWHKLGGVREKLIGSAPLPCSAGEPRLVFAQKMRDGRYSYINKHGDYAHFRVNFTCWKDSFQEKGAFDDVTFVAEGRPVYSNKGYMAYISPMMRILLTGHFKEAQTDEVPITQTSAEDFVMFMRAVASFGDRVSDANVQVLYGLADVYDVEFLRRDCEKHLMVVKGIKTIDKPSTNHKPPTIARASHLVGSLSRADLKKIEKVKRKEELSAEIKDQLCERGKLFS